MRSENQKNLTAVILAAGAGKRFLRSGGFGYKQMAIHRGEPIILRLVRQIFETELFAKLTVVLGNDENCQKAIQSTLLNYDVDYKYNKNAGSDNNLISFRTGIGSEFNSTLILEADCVITTEDIIAMVNSIGSNEIRWSNIGSADNFDYGGIIEIDPKSFNVIGIDVLNKNDFKNFKLSGRLGRKMFGMTAFGADVLERYCEEIDRLPDKYQKYFHYEAIRNSNKYFSTTVEMSTTAFSFNTVGELDGRND